MVTTFKNRIREGMTLPLSDALQLENDKGSKINFQLTSNPLNGELPKYYCEDYETKRVYSLSLEHPYDLVTLRITDISEEQIKQQSQLKAKK